MPERCLHGHLVRRQQCRDFPDARRHGLDVQPCTKIQAVQSAAKDLIDIVVWSDQSQYYSRVALAPFAEAVNVGTTLAPLVRGTVTANTSVDARRLLTTTRA